MIVAGNHPNCHVLTKIQIETHSLKGIFGITMI